MSPRTLDGPLQGRADPRLGEIVDTLDGYLAADPDLSFQVAAFHRGQSVLDAWGGPHLAEDSVMVPYSVTKNTIGLSIGLLVERGHLDLDQRVAHYWPEFAAKGKGWVDYQYKNPTSGKIEPKTTYILRVDDVVLEAGIYKK